MRRTRIVATVGPASAADAVLAELLDAGVDVFRLNFSHGTRDEHAALAARLRRIAGDRPAAILQDLGGPKLRLDRPLAGRPGDVVELSLPATVRPGDPVLVADGKMQLEVLGAGKARVIVGGEIPAGKGVNLPSSRLEMPSLTEKDRADLRCGVEIGVDFVALSFVRQASDLDEVRAAGLPVIAKIEKAQALDHIDDIVRAADGLMVARGDLGVELPIERVPVVQKQLIALANRAGKPVITATQMLGSMVESPLPTRAEATDVANAVLDGTDAVMLSEESAVGRHPVAAVAVMGRILAQAEALLAPRPGAPDHELPDVIADTACRIAAEVAADAIIVPTRTGSSARKVASHRPRAPILALTPEAPVRRRLALVWGVESLAVPWLTEGGADPLAAACTAVRATGRLAAGARVVIIAGWPVFQKTGTNLVHVTTL